jgi:DNA ligase (NAD+)
MQVFSAANRRRGRLNPSLLSKKWPLRSKLQVSPFATHSKQPSITPPTKARQQYAAWTSLLAQHDHHYHNLGTPTVTDADYDSLRASLLDLLATHPSLADTDTDTDKHTPLGVGAEPEAMAQAEQCLHSFPMLSLENSFEEEGVRAFVSRLLERATLTDTSGSTSSSSSSRRGGVRVVVEPKIDGISLSLRYEDGRLVRAGE